MKWLRGKQRDGFIIVPVTFELMPMGIIFTATKTMAEIFGV